MEAIELLQLLPALSGKLSVVEIALDQMIIALHRFLEQCNIEDRRNEAVGKVTSFKFSGEGAEDRAVGADQNAEHTAVTALHQGASQC